MSKSRRKSAVLSLAKWFLSQPTVYAENPPNFQKEDNMSKYKITALYERLSIGDERQGREGELESKEKAKTGRLVCCPSACFCSH